MKKVILSVLALAATVSGAYAQFTAKDVFKKDEIVYYGLDFSKAKFIGEFDQGAGIGGQAKGSDIKTKWVPTWNTWIVSKQNDYDFKKAMDKASIYYDTKPVDANNASMDKDNIMSMNAWTVKKEDAEAAIAGYTEGDKKEGIGMVLVVESFDKINAMGNFWVVYFDIKTKKVLFSEHASAKAHGGGLRNYWAGSVKSLIAEMDKSLWGDWKKKYGK